MADEGSPKFQDQEVGPPVEVSVKTTSWPGCGEAGAKLNAAVGAVPEEETTTACMTGALEPEPFVDVSVTL